MDEQKTCNKQLLRQYLYFTQVNICNYVGYYFIEIYDSYVQLHVYMNINI